MDAKRFALVALSGLMMALGARAQTPTAVTPPGSDSTVVSVPGAMPASATGSPATGYPATGYDVPGVSNWIRRDPAPCCTGPVGGNPAIGTELFARSGVSLPLGSDRLLNRNTTVGFMIQAGVRTLFYNHAYDRAWFVDTTIGNTQNSGVPEEDSEQFFINGLRPLGQGLPPLNTPYPVTIRGVSRTAVGLGMGREWFIGSAKDCGPRWRFSFDGGGRYGTMSMRVRENVHRTDVIGGVYTGGQASYEFPCWNNTIFNIGFRTEYAYTWSDILQRATDMSEINLLLHFGCRY